MREAGGNPSLKQRLLDWLVKGGSIRSFAAKNTERSYNTYWRWASDPTFKTLVRRRSGEIGEAVARRLKLAGTRSTEELLRLLKDKDPAIRLQASRAILRNMIDVAKLTELDDRMTAIEAKLSAPPVPHPHPGPVGPAPSGPTGAPSA